MENLHGQRPGNLQGRVDLRPLIDFTEFHHAVESYHSPIRPWHHALYDARAHRIAWFAYSAFVGISAVHSYEISNGNKNLTTQAKRFWLILAVVTMLGLLAVAPVWLLKGAARVAGIYDDTPAWFAIDKELLLPHHTSLLSWKTKRECSQSDKFSYLYGTVAYQFGGSITVICPVGITPGIGTENRCLTFQDQKITRAIPCEENSHSH
ncbi:hypothetical protein OL229_03620 [Neisseriaceae bacterium JH1-16]|nr:hypothetical protein [Neisseriaceae bacterium JH1-16]